jgi:hypothetical protein
MASRMRSPKGSSTVIPYRVLIVDERVKAMSKASRRRAVQASVRMARSKRPYPEGDRVQMTPAWKALVLAEMERRGWGRERLATELGVDRSLIYKIFPTSPREDEVMNSAIVPQMCELLSLPPPMEPTEIARSDQDRKILELVRALTPETKDSLITFIEGLLKRPKA